MALAIECDGASFDFSATSRDRDRLRHEHIERLDWRFHGSGPGLLLPPGA